MGVKNGDLSTAQRISELELSDRGAKVMALALDGMTWQGIADELGVSYNTARRDIIKANKAALEKRDKLAASMLAKMGAELNEGQAFCMAVVEDVQRELALLEKANISRGRADKKSKLEKRALLALDRYDKLAHRYATLMGMVESGRASVTIQGVSTIQLTLGGVPVEPLPEPPPEGPGTVEGTLVKRDDTE